MLKARCPAVVVVTPLSPCSNWTFKQTTHPASTTPASVTPLEDDELELLLEDDVPLEEVLLVPLEVVLLPDEVPPELLELLLPDPLEPPDEEVHPPPEDALVPLELAPLDPPSPESSPPESSAPPSAAASDMWE
jgi:hypothetical protein